MSLHMVTPEQAKRLLAGGAVLLDIREADEHTREKIPGARHFPLSKLDGATLPVQDHTAVIFHCRSGARTKANAPLLAGKVAEGCEAFIVEGGLDAWKKAGLPVTIDRRQPLELQRQVQIAVGSMALAGTLLGLLVSPWLFIVPAFVGAGLIVAGATGFCGMAHLLMRAPWNRTFYGGPASPA